ncbi:outer membrane beta-barrel protein [Labilibacter marinus]|uniref:outer membrane beta-barrel protein n=1 Tax=Labilibacter marinus TaxID=1477105 RepID=UPI000836458D|nr:outer membrane beta-barrel protein [Labilibacter marinus]
MKKLIFIAIITVMLFATIINAASQEKKYGFRAGYQRSVMMMNSEQQGESNGSYYLGAFRDAKMFPFMYFQSGLEFIQMGAKIDNSKYTLSYIGVPLGLKCKVGPIYGFGGAMVNFKVSEKASPYDQKAKWYDTNAYLGAGINVIMFSLEAKYMWGLTEVSNGLHNNGFQLGCGIRF